ncbi:hypothetical protein [Marinomonas sp. THO17]|uniref:hypothetical protein n=1 Tax=Marinomonas sp. THO17 TaxID=3149048 RepID=UPI00336BF701
MMMEITETEEHQLFQVLAYWEKILRNPAGNTNWIMQIMKQKSDQRQLKKQPAGRALRKEQISLLNIRGLIRTFPSFLNQLADDENNIGNLASPEVTYPRCN